MLLSILRPNEESKFFVFYRFFFAFVVGCFFLFEVDDDFDFSVDAGATRLFNLGIHSPNFLRRT